MIRNESDKTQHVKELEQQIFTWRQMIAEAINDPDRWGMLPKYRENLAMV